MKRDRTRWYIQEREHGYGEYDENRFYVICNFHKTRTFTWERGSGRGANRASIEVGKRTRGKLKRKIRKGRRKMRFSNYNVYLYLTLTRISIIS